MASITVTPAGARFRVRWTESGKRHQRTFATAAQAEEFTARQAAASLFGHPASVPSIGQFVQRWTHSRPMSAVTAKRVESTRVRLLEPFFGDRPLDTIRAADIRGWVQWLNDEHQHSPATIRSHFCVLRAALNTAVDENLIPHNPCTRVALPRVPRTHRPEALTRMHRRALAATVTSAHHRVCDALSELRHAVTGADSVAEITTRLRHLAFDTTSDTD